VLGRRREREVRKAAAGWMLSLGAMIFGRCSALLGFLGGGGMVGGGGGGISSLSPWCPPFPPPVNTFSHLKQFGFYLSSICRNPRSRQFCWYFSVSVRL
jgi:hypothetical protein